MLFKNSVRTSKRTRNELFIKQNALLRDFAIRFISQRLQSHHWLGSHCLLSDYSSYLIVHIAFSVNT